MVIGYESQPNGLVCLKCRCDCGVEKAIRRDYLRRGLQISCGCFIREKLKAGKICRKRKSGESAFNCLYVHHKAICRRKSTPTELSFEEFKVLLQGNCAYCGFPPSRKFTRPGLNGEIVVSSIDRVNSQEGYIRGNVVSCCIRCQWAKNASPVEDFLEWMKHVAKVYSEGFTPSIPIKNVGSLVSR